MKELKETTQVRLIKSEAKSAILEEREAILGGVKALTDSLKREMVTHFATKADLLDWKLQVYKENEIRVNEAIKLHVHQDHKASLTNGRVSLMPKSRLSKKQVGMIVGAVATFLTALAALIQQYVTR